MTKETEVKILDDTITKLGQDSYLGPWLMMNYDAIISDIRSDMSISMVLPNAARIEGARMIAEAKNEAAKIKREANEWAAAVRDKTRIDTEDLRQRLRREIIKLADKV
jgi:vacuolar-type H+-ATPase subunit E/Vma4